VSQPKTNILKKFTFATIAVEQEISNGLMILIIILFIVQVVS